MHHRPGALTHGGPTIECQHYVETVLFKIIKTTSMTIVSLDPYKAPTKNRSHDNSSHS